MDIVDWSEAAKNLMSTIGDILSLTDAATLQVTSKRKPRVPMQARSSTVGERWRQTHVDVETLNQPFEAKGWWLLCCIIISIQYLILVYCIQLHGPTYFWFSMLH